MTKIFRFFSFPTCFIEKVHLNSTLHQLEIYMLNTMKSALLLVFVGVIAFACGSKKNQEINISGTWHAQLDIDPDKIPFELELLQKEGKWFAEIHNGEEILPLDDIIVQNDSLFISMGIFDSQIRAKITDDNTLTGSYIRNYVTDYMIPFSATKGKQSRFSVTEAPAYDFSGNWKTIFQKENGDVYESVGIFVQKEDKIYGTFLTELGDYRFLEGNVSGNIFYLSAFDGSHAYFFTAEIQPDNSLIGRFRSGPKYQETFIAVRDDEFNLTDANTMTTLKEGVNTLNFTFPDTDGNMVSLSDKRFKNKVVLVQLFGTWCPNCMDETKYLAPWYEKMKDKDVEIIALAFESKPEFEYASKRVKNAQEKLKANYTFLIAGESNKEKAAQALPELSKVIAFPTLIYLNKKGEVQNIHTGFNGPGTGVYYQRWIEEHEALIKKLLEE
jgi:thiol-disulfide isomerase/thioredoxin